MYSKKNKDGKISSAEAKQALLRSGYLLESRIETFLDNNRYYVLANTAYPDSATGKSRELDIYATHRNAVNPDGDIWDVLLIECINNPQPIVFITKEPQVADSHNLRLAGLPVKIIAEDEEYEEAWIALQEFLEMDKYIHYCKGCIATQYCSFVKKKDGSGWMALHEDNHFNSFQKLADALEYFVDRKFNSRIIEGDEPVDLEVYYLVLIVQGDLIDARPGKRSVRFIKTNHIQYKHTIAAFNRMRPDSRSA